MDNAKKKQIKKITTWVLLAALVAGLTAMPLLAKAETGADGPEATIHSGTVETGTIHTALHGGGILQTEDIEQIELPSGVKITEFLVKNGDAVTAGTPLAAVDKVSVMTAITSVTETMEYLQEEMKSAKTEKVSSTVAATAGGRVKKVYARKGDSVQEVMLRDGALALLSLDGLMAVEIEKKLALPTGDTVTVTLADGETVTGRVASNLDGVIVITIEDQGYEIDQTVTVTEKDGKIAVERAKTPAEILDTSLSFIDGLWTEEERARIQANPGLTYEQTLADLEQTPQGRKILQKTFDGGSY